jgi:UDP-GlcNAc:undecaprenyl-phosphate GlcNAc-1-phosphate transferase
VTFLYTLLLSIFLTVGTIPLLQPLALRLKMVDLPGGRKIHTDPIPRVGGIAMALGAFVPVAIWSFDDPFVRAFLAGAAVMVAFGIADDAMSLSPKWKFLGQFAAALVVVFLGGLKIRTLGTLLPEGTVLPDWAGIPLTVIAIVGVTNAINLADGLDGLAGGICLLIFACLGYLAWLQEEIVIGLVCLALAGAIFGFLRFNTHPASVFMGDTGSQLLGFSSIVLSLRLTQGNTALSPVLPLVLLGLPILDTATVMALRISEGRSPFSADRFHLHHNLIALGLQQGESVVVIYAVQMVLVVSAFFFRFHSDWLLLGGCLAFSAATLLFFMVANRRGWKREDAGELRDYFGSEALRRMKTEGTAIRKLFPLFEVALPLLLLVKCLVPSRLPAYVPPAAALFFAAIVAARIFRKERLGDVLRITVYLTVPAVVYAGSNHPSWWVSGAATRLVNGAFIALALLDIAVSKLSKRKEGFKSTPLDFLIFLLALIIPNLPDQNLEQYDLGVVGAKIVILYFSYEVLLAEDRLRYDRVMAGTLAALAVLVLKGVFG